MTNMLSNKYNLKNNSIYTKHIFNLAINIKSKS